ncbi:MAG: hypothetical protein DESF_02547 [Desulfovibrio sp.]
MLPGFPGCFSGADILEEVPAAIQDAVGLWAEDEKIDPPTPSTFDDVAKLESAQGGVLMLVDVSFDFLNQKAVPVNITMPVYMRDRIDSAAKRSGLNRLQFLQRPAQSFIDASR